ncbi:MAG: GNAT family N-acetyltransferase [Planctomycetaceae bacterium]
MDQPVARGPRTHLRPLVAGDRDEFLAAERRSRRLHRPWTHAPSTPEAFARYVTIDPARRSLGIFRADGADLAGVYNLSQLFYGPFRNAYLGYFAFEPWAGQGYMREGMDLLLRHAFVDLRLHRIQANVQPGNARSIGLLRASGWREEGYAPRYLKIGGRWRDHLMFAILADDRGSRRAAGDPVRLEPVTRANWRDVVAVRVRRDQRRWVADVTRYLSLCTYEPMWRPLAIVADGRTVGFMMWGRDPDDDSLWIGGFMIDARDQGKGYGAAALAAAIDLLSAQPGARQLALSYRPDNEVAKRLYASRGFAETGETVTDEVVARRPVHRRA